MNNLVAVAYTFDWSELAFSSKKRVDQLKAVYLLPPREITETRFIQIVKQYLPQANMIIGIAKESFVAGFDNQPQFKTLTLKHIQNVINKVNNSKSNHKIYILKSFQSEQKYIIEKLLFSKIIAINGSWNRSFHTLDLYYAIVNKEIKYELLSAFSSELEAKQYEISTDKNIKLINRKTNVLKLNQIYSEHSMIKNMRQIAKSSYDYTFQTGCVLGRQINKHLKYHYLGYAFNKVVPFQTYAMLNGSQREIHFSPPNDLNHYDTVHAEIGMLLFAQKHNVSLKGTTLFVSLLPCPSCAFMISETDIESIVYLNDHTNGFAFEFLTKAGKKIRRVAEYN
jgi:deoxycytidylate deaminase